MWRRINDWILPLFLMAGTHNAKFPVNCPLSLSWDCQLGFILAGGGGRLFNFSFPSQRGLFLQLLPIQDYYDLSSVLQFQYLTPDYVVSSSKNIYHQLVKWAVWINLILKIKLSWNCRDVVCTNFNLRNLLWVFIHNCKYCILYKGTLQIAFSDVDVLLVFTIIYHSEIHNSSRVAKSLWVFSNSGFTLARYVL